MIKFYVWVALLMLIVGCIAYINGKEETINHGRGTIKNKNHKRVIK